MITLTLALAAALSSTAPHRIAVEHRDAPYDVEYRPQLQTRLKTVGIALPNRASTERCHWSADVRVERIVRRSGAAEGHGTILPAMRTIEGSLPGNCSQAGVRIAQDQAGRQDAVRRHVAAVAAADRHTLLADIDAAHALAPAD